MSYQEEYRQKLTTAGEAVKAVKSGDWLDYGWSVCSPNALDKALAVRMGELRDVNIRGGILTRRPAIFDVADPGDTLHQDGVERKAIKEGFAYYIPLRYSELPGYYRDCIKTLDVAMFQVAPMDEHGWFNFGPGGSHLKAVCECAKTIIVEVNKNMPVCLGGFENCVHISDVAMIVEGENPPMEILGGASAASEVDLAVANLVVPEIEDGACPRLHAQRHRQNDCRIRPEGPGCPYRDVRRRLRGHVQGGPHHRRLQALRPRPSDLCLRRRDPEAV